jgi:hypothetical protein
VLWICRDCGTEASAKDAALAIGIGWTALDGHTGLCPICSHPTTASRTTLLDRSRARIRQSRERVVITRERIR